MAKWTPDDLEDRKYLGHIPWNEARTELLDWLVGADRRRRKLAATMLVQMGRLVLPDLTQVLMGSADHPEMQMRLLGVAEAIGGRPTPELSMALLGLTMFGPQRVQLEAGLVAKLRRSAVPAVAASSPQWPAPVAIQNGGDTSVAGLWQDRR